MLAYRSDTDDTEEALREVLQEEMPSHSVETPATLMQGLISHDMWSKMGEAQQAGWAWNVANGEVERTHTTGVYVRHAANATHDLILGVYVDTHARLSDFSANREVYRIRLHEVGFDVTAIEFKLNRRPFRPRSHRREDTDGTRDVRRVALSPEDEERVEQEVSVLPPRLRDAARRAMTASLQRDGS